MSIFDPIGDEKIRVGAAYLWVASTPNSLRMVDLIVPTTPVYGIPSRVPVPTSGKFLGYTSGIKQSFQSQYTERTKNGSLSFTSVHVAKEEFTVSGNLVFNNDWSAIKYLLPPGSSSSLSIRGGGQTVQPRYPLLVVLENRLKDSSVYPIIYYYRGYFKSAIIESGREFRGIDFEYHSGSGVDENGCLLAAGARNYCIYWFDSIKGTIVSPSNPDTVPMEDSLISDFFPLIYSL
jgi:hypothetical protein